MRNSSTLRYVHQCRNVDQHKQSTVKPTGGHPLTRRELQRLLLIAPAPLAAALMAGRHSGIALSEESSASPEATPSLAPTPECGDDDDLELTVSQAEGPFFTPESPERPSLLEESVLGTELHLSGYIYSTSCRPVPGALVEFWQADDDGVYDNEGYRLRGHQFADDDGRYELATTILPGIYPGRTRHIHVKIQAPNGPVLTTQIHFPDDPGNASDRIFDERLFVDLSSEDDRLVASSRLYFRTGNDPGPLQIEASVLRTLAASLIWRVSPLVPDISNTRGKPHGNAGPDRCRLA